MACFNPRARVGRDRPDRPATRATTRFNPRARVGRDIRYPLTPADLDVSIHAPVWGATRISGCSRCSTVLFQSTRPCGARRPRVHRCGAIQAVSIHAPVWGATRRSRRWRRLTVVSIHAPVWGATNIGFLRFGSRTSFNPRARVGRDDDCPAVFGCDRAFQSTRPCGARLMRCRPGWRSMACFNPRARVGRDSSTLAQSEPR